MNYQNVDKNMSEYISKFKTSSFVEKPTKFTVNSFENAAIDQTGNRLAFSVSEKGLVFIYNYDDKNIRKKSITKATMIPFSLNKEFKIEGAFYKKNSIYCN